MSIKFSAPLSIPKNKLPASLATKASPVARRLSLKPPQVSVGEVAEKRYAFPLEQLGLLDNDTRFAGVIAPGFWHYDHAMEVTRFNVYAGLAAGMRLVRHPLEEELALPTDKHKPLVVIHDRNFDTVNIHLMSCPLDLCNK